MAMQVRGELSGIGEVPVSGIGAVEAKDANSLRLVVKVTQGPASFLGRRTLVDVGVSDFVAALPRQLAASLLDELQEMAAKGWRAVAKPRLIEIHYAAEPHEAPVIEFWAKAAMAVAWPVYQVQFEIGAVDRAYRRGKPCEVTAILMEYAREAAAIWADKPLPSPADALEMMREFME